MHDLPPPTLFSDGSLKAELKDPFTSVTPSAGRWIHTSVPTCPNAKDPFIAAVRVQQGNGDTIYQDLDPTNIVITIDLKDSNGGAGDLKISGGASFKIDSDEKLIDHGAHSGAKGRQKYSHPGKGGRTFKISHIKINKGASTVFEVNTPIDYEEEYRVMIWHAGDH